MKNMRKGLALLLSLLMLFSASLGTIAAYADEVDTTDFDAFVANLQVLENYSHDYAQATEGQNEVLNVINYIRTGVDKYTTSSWTILAGDENTAFTQYVAAQDAANGTTASALKDIQNFYAPNGDDVDFAHMFGSMDVAYYSTAQGASAALVQARADLSSWAGDVCDLMWISSKDKAMAADDVETLSQMIYDKYLGQNYDYAFGQDDIYGDMDAFYILEQLKTTDKRISQIISEYFNPALNDEMRVDYFLKNRFNGVLSRNDIRTLVYRAYVNNSLLYSLECSRKIQSKTEFRKASLYAFADYLFYMAGDPDAEDTVGEEEEPLEDNEYYSVFSSTVTNLAPGIDQEVKYALTKDNKQMAYYLSTVDITRDDVNIYANYNNNDPSSWAMARTTDQMAVIQAKHSNPNDAENYIENYNTIVGINADFFNMTTGEPTGTLVMEGVQYSEHNYRADRGFFAILKDGTPVIGSGTDWDEIADDVQEAVGGSVVIIKNGELVNQGIISDYYGRRAPRTAIGITPEGKLVLMVLDGRQEPFSTGGNLAEIAQIMLDAGCVEAINLDGGGSSTFAAKQEGSDEVTIVNRPSDGYERSVSSSLVVVSTAEPSDIFDHVLIETENDYLTPGSSLSLMMNGVSTTGNSAEIPADAVYQLVNDGVGHIEDGVFYADAEGAVEVQVVSNGEVIGSKTLNVVQPDRIFFTKTSMDVIFGTSVELPINATYNGNAVTINENDFFFSLSKESAGTIDGLTFTASEDSGLNNVMIQAQLSNNFDVKAIISISMYDEDAARFDFDNAMMGDRLLAWNHVVNNATTADNKTYYIVDPDEEMSTDFTFAIDARAIPFPPQLVNLVGMVAGSDVEGITPWLILLQLAERVSNMTEVTVTLDFEEGMDIDYSALTVVNDYFYLKNAYVDETTNTLIVKVGWYKQTEPIDQESANPICILSGIHVTPNENAAWNEDGTLNVPLSGLLHYDIGLRASSLYTMSQDPAFQAEYGIEDYINPNDPTDKGGFMKYDFLTMEDIYTLDRSYKQGWATKNGKLYYFADNEPLTGVQLVPGIDDAENLYYYDLGEDGTTHDLYTGFLNVDGGKVYAILGVPAKGWKTIDDKIYYFDKHGKAVTGTKAVGGIHEYTFDDEGVLIRGSWGEVDGHKVYYWAGGRVLEKLFEIDGDTYFFNNKGYMQTGLIKYETVKYNKDTAHYYLLGEDGKLITEEGFHRVNGDVYYIEDGYPCYKGLFEHDGDLYYINSTLVGVKDCVYNVYKTNDILPQGKYTFDSDGKLSREPSKNGLVEEEDGTYYYVDGVRTYAGLIKIGNDYYYINSVGKMATGKKYVYKTNDLFPEDTYDFGTDGKMKNIPGDVVKNGLVEEEDGTYYYVDGVKTYAGLIKIDNDYYYINSLGKMATGKKHVYKTNDLFPEDTYDFGTDGKMKNIPGDVVKNGLVEEEDGTYYYVDGVKTYAGLIKIDNDYYYINSLGKMATGQKYLYKTNDLLPEGTYTFGADGKMIQ